MNSPQNTDKNKSGVFLDFFFALRRQGLKVTPNQWLAVIEGMDKGLHGSSLIGFYSLSRSILVKDETELDDFDMVFSTHFEDAADKLDLKIRDEIEDWLKNPISPYVADPSLAKIVNDVDVEALKKLFEQRLRDQTESHNGGARWIGTGGTSPFGHSGFHPGGFRIGGQRRNGSAIQVAANRQYKQHRRDITLDIRQFGVALKKLRALKRDGICEELDITQTINQTAKQGGELELVFRAPRANNLSLILAMDVGGSMEPYRHLVNLLFSAAHGARQFKNFKNVYFHNCIYDCVYEDSFFENPVSLKDIMANNNSETRLIIVGDAHMYPGELTQRYGAINWNDQNEKPGLFYLSQLCSHFKHSAWLNPIGSTGWNAPSIRMIRQVFKMYDLTVDGVEQLSKNLGEN